MSLQHERKHEKKQKSKITQRSLAESLWHYQNELPLSQIRLCKELLDRTRLAVV